MMVMLSSRRMSVFERRGRGGGGRLCSGHDVCCVVFVMLMLVMVGVWLGGYHSTTTQ